MGEVEAKVGEVMDRVEGETLERGVDLLHFLAKGGKTKAPPHIQIARTLQAGLVKAYGAHARLAAEEITEAWKKRPYRSYASFQVDVPKRWEMPQYYATYLMELAGIFLRSLLEAAQRRLQEGEERGMGVNDLADYLGEVLPLGEARLKTIVRTEGTRVAAAARRDIAARAIKTGYGPQWLIYSAILDDRVTHTCHFAHRHKRPADPNHPYWRLLPPPNHYNCRSIERYGFSWIPEDVAVPDWDPNTISAFLDIRSEEFPEWVPRPLPPSFVPVTHPE